MRGRVCRRRIVGQPQLSSQLCQGRVVSARLPNDPDAERRHEELYRAYTGAGLTDTVFMGPTYYRLKTVKLLQDRGLLTDHLRWR